MKTPTDAPADLAGCPADVAIPVLVERYGGKLYGLGLKLCGSPEMAEDLVQDTFLQAFRNWHQFEGRAQPSSWLYAIAAHACQRHNRLRAGEPAHMASFEELMPAPSGPVADLQDFSSGPLADMLREEAAEIVDAALLQVPIDFRLPLVLKEIAELSMREIADILDLKPATVKTRVYRARLALRNALVESLPKKAAKPADHPQEVCLDMLQAKLQALDHDAPYPVPEDELCVRCRAVFDSLDLTVEACRWIGGKADLTPGLRQRLERLVGRERPAEPSLAG